MAEGDEGPVSGPASAKMAVIHRPSNIEDQLEAKCKSEGGAWYPCKVVEIIGMNRVIVQFEDDDQEEVDALTSLRFAAVPMEPDDCPALVPGFVVSGFNKREDLDQWFNARVVSVDRRPHDEDGECRCAVTVEWLEGRFRGQQDALTADFIAFHQSSDTQATGPCCSLCQRTRSPMLGPVLQVEEDGATYGLHELCIAWSPDVFQNPEDNEDTWRGVGEAVTRGKAIKCAKCKGPGATLACFNPSGCKTTTSTSFVSKSYHFICALELPGSRLDQGKMEFYCPKHATAHVKAQNKLKAEEARRAEEEKRATEAKANAETKAAKPRRPVKELKRKRVAGGAPTPSGSPEEADEGKGKKRRGGGRGRAAGAGRAKDVAAEIEDERGDQAEGPALTEEERAAERAAAAERQRKSKAWEEMNSESSVKHAEEERRNQEEEEAARLDERIATALAAAASAAAATRRATAAWEQAIDTLTATARKAKREGCEVAKAALPAAKAAVAEAKAAELEATKVSKEAASFVDILKNTQYQKSLQRKERERKEGAGAGRAEPAAWYEREKAAKQQQARERARAKKLEEERRRAEQRRQFEEEERARVERERAERERKAREKEKERARARAALTFDKAAWHQHQVKWNQFLDNVPASITFDMIPWPPNKLQMKQALENGLWGGSRKKAHLQYHTDKRMAVVAKKKGASEAETGRIIEELTAITVQLNELKKSEAKT